jgi:hypothetical protein
MNQNTTDLADADAPEKVAIILRRVADKYRESTGELQSAWGDQGIVIWDKLATILERAARSCETAVSRYV